MGTVPSTKYCWAPGSFDLMGTVPSTINAWAPKTPGFFPWWAPYPVLNTAGHLDPAPPSKFCPSPWDTGHWVLGFWRWLVSFREKASHSAERTDTRGKVAIRSLSERPGNDGNKKEEYWIGTTQSYLQFFQLLFLSNLFKVLRKNIRYRIFFQYPELERNMKWYLVNLLKYLFCFLDW